MNRDFLVAGVNDRRAVAVHDVALVVDLADAAVRTHGLHARAVPEHERRSTCITHRCIAARLVGGGVPIGRFPGPGIVDPASSRGAIRPVDRDFLVAGVHDRRAIAVYNVALVVDLANAAVRPHGLHARAVAVLERRSVRIANGRIDRAAARVIVGGSPVGRLPGASIVDPTCRRRAVRSMYGDFLVTGVHDRRAIAVHDVALVVDLADAAISAHGLNARAVSVFVILTRRISNRHIDTAVGRTADRTARRLCTLVSTGGSTTRRTTDPGLAVVVAGQGIGVVA